MSDSKTSYQQILKTASLFGGVQFFTIIFSVIRTKLIAIFIGPAGMGIISLLNSTLSVISSFTSLGIETSSVKHVSENYIKADLDSAAPIVTVIKKLAVVTGIFGTVITLVLSKWLSILTFGNSDHTFSFVFLSVTLLLKQLASGELVVLQGLRRMKLLAQANFYGNLFGLLFSVPFYYFLGIDAILPTIIITSFSALFFAFFYSKKIKIKKAPIDDKEWKAEGKSIVRLGIMLTVSSLFTLLAAYLIQVYIGKQGGLEQVGYYNAGFTLLNSYVGVIFTVMSTDYFPKLAAVNDDNVKVRNSVAEQSFVSILIITPIIILFLTFIPLIVKIIYTPKFNAVIPMVCFGILGMLFRAVSWSMGFVLLAKGDSKMFIRTAVGFSILSFVLTVFGYYFYGLEGAGFSFFVYYIIHFIALKIITKKRYNFYFDSDFYLVYFICLVMCAVTFLLRYLSDPILKYSLMSLMVLMSLTFVLFQINKKVEFRNFLNSILKRKND